MQENFSEIKLPEIAKHLDDIHDIENQLIYCY